MNLYLKFFPKFKIEPTWYCTFHYMSTGETSVKPIKFGVKKRVMLFFYRWIRDSNRHWIYSPIGVKTQFSLRESAQAYINQEMIRLSEIKKAK